MVNLTKLTRYHSIVLAFDKIFYLLLSVGTARYFTVGEFGEFQTIIFQVGILATCIGSSLPYVINNYVKSDLIKLKFVFLYAFIISTLFLLVVLISSFVAMQSEVSDFLLLVFPLLLFQILLPLSKQAFIISERITYSIIVNLVLYPVSLFCMYCLYLQNNLNTESTVRLLTILYASIFVFSFLVNSRVKGGTFPSIFSIKLSAYKSLAVTISVISISALYENLDQLFVSWVYSSETFALYRIGNFRLPFIEIVTGSLAAVLIAKVPSMIKNDDFDLLKKEWKAVTSKNTQLLLPIIIFCIFTPSYAIQFIFGDKYVEAAIIYSVYLSKFLLASITIAPVIISLGGGGELSRLYLIFTVLELFLLYAIYNFFHNNVLIIVILALLFQYIMVFLQARYLKIKHGIRFLEVFDIRVFIKTLIISISLSILFLFLLSYFSFGYIYTYPFFAVLYYVLVQLVMGKLNDSISIRR
ncbi:oligosaccharide flippase family protein [Shewanella acanthi]|uniref:oligosaccharide flippase family protein n=1 Tax=Shewanella acanthi TaxID=2864212 RepID=UPI001C65C25A|nr:oligosaccharide flippase family protein [Shewanella acanthi]QYJ79926.1 oligosaccharide flippase family protein [Shewanella acanthi]